MIEIPVIVNPPPDEPVPSLNVQPILHEVRHALAHLLASGESTAIDLRAMPLAPGEDKQLREALGDGEAEIQIEALGPSVASETAYPGVWWVEHRNATNVLVGLYIEIAHVPAILVPDDVDLRDSLARLSDDLNNDSDE